MTGEPKKQTGHEQLATLVFEMVQPRTAAELAFYADISDRAVEKYIAAFRERKLVYISDWQYRPKTGKYVPKYMIDLTGRKKDVNPPRV